MSSPSQTHTHGRTQDASHAISHDVLVVGAGPAGMMLAGQLQGGPAHALFLFSCSLSLSRPYLLSRQCALRNRDSSPWSSTQPRKTCMPKAGAMRFSVGALHRSGHWQPIRAHPADTPEVFPPAHCVRTIEVMRSIGIGAKLVEQGVKMFTRTFWDTTTTPPRCTSRSGFFSPRFDIDDCYRCVCQPPARPFEPNPQPY